ncbi:hypothetical protein [Streptomyces sp. NBC_00354]|uniref:hypothetical protein n=1 Tax=Streptomyces sp. NBC_00354 TaxID=2975723 RepID=UPI002E255D94
MLLVDIAQRVVIPVTNLPDPGTEGVPCDDSFALFELGICFLGTLRSWHEQAGPAAAEGIARAVIRFTVQILTEPHEDVADILEQLMAVALGQALDAHPAPGPHPVGRHHRRVVRCGVHSGRCGFGAPHPARAPRRLVVRIGALGAHATRSSPLTRKRPEPLLKVSEE